MGQVQQQQRGQIGPAQRTLQMAVDSAQSTQDKLAEATAWRALALLLHTQHDAPAAQAALTQALQLFEGLGLSHEIEKTKALV